MNKRETEIFQGLCELLSISDDPLEMAESWALEVAKVRCDNERLRATLKEIKTLLAGQQGPVTAALRAICDHGTEPQA